jgi:7,8-dihydroneopterin aldolase/epimerase/oxygenase
VSVRIELYGLELHACHGVLEEERRSGRRFLFDLELDVPATAVRSDRIEDAVDYRQVAAAVREVSDGRRFHLLEALADAVAESLLERFPAERVRVRVRKPEVALDPPVEHAAVTVERERGRAPS